MKTRVKLVKVKNDYFECLVDGVRCRYLIQRPQPLTSSDSAMLRGVMDTRLLESLMATMPVGNFLQRWFSRFQSLRGVVLTRIVRADGQCSNEFVKPGYVPRTFGGAVADYIGKVGVEVNIDRKTRGVVLLKSDVDKIREGKV